jgi:GNAT superfamily N-acetyltransferase
MRKQRDDGAVQLRIEPKAYEVPMSEIRRIASPDGRYELLLASTEMRMSHWVTSAALWERASQRLLLQLGGGLWSSEEITWSADSRVVIEDLYVQPDSRGQDIGGALLERLFAVARQEGIQRFVVGTKSKETDKIVRFYRSHGFTPWRIQFFK